MARPSRGLFADAATARHEALHAAFRWRVPARFHIGEACVGRWARATPHAVAVRWRSADGERVDVDFAALDDASRRLATVLARLGVARGDRVAIVLPQRPETSVAHFACHRLGAIAMPLSHLFGPDAIAFRLDDAEARVVIADEAGLAALEAVPASTRARLGAVVAVGSAHADVRYASALAAATPHDGAAPVGAEDPALLIYTSGTTGPPKGALIPHRALVGNLPGFVASQNWFPVADGGGVDRDAVFWSPADWAWTGGLMDALLPTLYFGRTIVGDARRFDAVRALDLMAQERVTHTFLFPTALKAMMKAEPAPRERRALALRSIMSAGEALGGAVRQWAREALGVEVNEMFGQTEVNYLVGQCGRVVDRAGRVAAGWHEAADAGSMGRAYPGHRIAVLDDEGREAPRGAVGEIAVHRLDRHGVPDPIFFAGYWRQPDATRAKFTGDPAASWCRTGDLGTMDADGRLRYQGRADDLFKSAGYRIGPSDIEDCLVQHPAVANAAVVPKPDAERGALVKAYVVLAPGHVADAALVDALQRHVKTRLAAYEAPKEIEFIDALPMTTTGKVQRRVLRLQEEARAARGPKDDA